MRSRLSFILENFCRFFVIFFPLLLHFLCDFCFNNSARGKSNINFLPCSIFSPLSPFRGWVLREYFHLTIVHNVCLFNGTVCDDLQRRFSWRMLFYLTNYLLSMKQHSIFFVCLILRNISHCDMSKFTIPALTANSSQKPRNEPKVDAWKRQ